MSERIAHKLVFRHSGEAFVWGKKKRILSKTNTSLLWLYTEEQPNGPLVSAMKEIVFSPPRTHTHTHAHVQANDQIKMHECAFPSHTCCAPRDLHPDLLSWREKVGEKGGEKKNKQTPNAVFVQQHCWLLWLHLHCPPYTGLVTRQGHRHCCVRHCTDRMPVGTACDLEPIQPQNAVHRRRVFTLPQARFQSVSSAPWGYCWP